MTHRPFKGRLGRTAGAFLAGMLLVAFQGHAATDSSDVEVRRLGVPAAETSTQTNAPDAATTIEDIGVWKAIEVADWRLARIRITQLQARYPTWTPPASMTDLIARGEHEAALSSARTAKDWTRILALTAGRPNCRDTGDIYARAEAFRALSEAANLTDHVLSSVAGCDRPDMRAELVGFGIDILDEAGLGRLSALVGSDPQSARLQNRIDTLAFRRLADAHDWKAAAEIARRIDTSDALAEAAWGLSETEPATARDLFARALERGGDEGAKFGFAATSLTLGDTAPARAFSDIPSAPDTVWTGRWRKLAASGHLAEGDVKRMSGDWTAAIQSAQKARALDPDVASDADALTGGALLAAAQSARDNGDARTALGLARQAARYPNAAHDADLLIAWTRLDLGEDAAARDAFSKLYDDLPDASSADGLVAASLRMNDLDGLASTAAGDNGPLRPVIDGALSDQAAYRGDYRTALGLAPDRHPDLQGYAHPWVSQSASVRQTRSGDGNSSAIVSTRTALGFSRGVTRIELGVATVAPEDEPASASPYVAIRTEGDLSFSLTASTTPINAVADTRPVGEAAMTLRQSNAETTASVFSRARDDTAETLLGAVDPATGQTYGGVIETGIQAGYRRLATDHVTASATVLASQVTAEGARDNQRLKAEVSASRSMDVDGLHYLSTGPFYSYETHSNNEGAIGPEHGGYYSPQSLHRAGWSVNFQTRERADWVVRLDAAAALETAHADAAPVLPISDPAGPRSEASDTTQGAVSATLRGIARINDNWAVTGAASVVSTTGYDDARIGLSLRYTPGGRSSLVGQDLQPDPFNKDIW